MTSVVDNIPTSVEERALTSDGDNSGVNYLNSLPAELISQICWYLNPEDIRSLMRTSREFTHITLGESNANSRSELIIFIQEMICTLNSTEFNPPIEDNTRNDLVTSLENMTKSLDADFPNLVSFEKYLKSQLQDITNLLCILEESQMNPLEKISCPMFCPDFFTVLPIWKRINAANTIPDDYLRSVALLHCSNTLSDLAKPDEALKVINTIPDNYLKSLALLHCSNILSELARPDEALKVINTTPSVYKRLCALKKHCKEQCALGNMECAVGIAQDAFTIVSHEVQDTSIISSVCLWVSKIFFDAGDFPNANTAIEMITDQHLKTEALEYCSNVGID